VLGCSRYVNPRRSNLENAKVHYLTKVLNDSVLFFIRICLLLIHTADREPGSKLSLREIREQVRIHPDLQNLTTEREQELLQELDEHRSRKKTGVKMTAAATATDISRTLARLGDEVRWLLCDHQTVVSQSFT
jgi:hypothetical protein